MVFDVFVYVVFLKSPNNLPRSSLHFLKNMMVITKEWSSDYFGLLWCFFPAEAAYSEGRVTLTEARVDLVLPVSLEHLASGSWMFTVISPGIFADKTGTVENICWSCRKHFLVT